MKHPSTPPDLMTRYLTAEVVGAEGPLGTQEVYFKWYSLDQHCLVLVLVPNDPSRGVKQWPISRDLMHFAFEKPGVDFGIGDVIVSAWPPEAVVISLYDAEKDFWLTYRIPGQRVAAIMRESVSIRPLPRDIHRAPRPYTRGGVRP